MGIAVGGSKGGPVSDSNIVPLIDVLLVLIIIFMVITPTVPTGLLPCFRSLLSLNRDPNRRTPLPSWCK
jgi:biopolymer transport protein ExbD